MSDMFGRFELHCHTHYSKGRKIPCEALHSPAEMVKEAKRKGLSGIAITDHINNKSWKEAEETAQALGMIFIPGIEIESKQGHILGLGLSDMVASGLSVDETMDKIHEQGGVSVAAHPFDLRGLGLQHDMNKADIAEAFNAMSIDRISNVFTARRARALEMPIMAGSDAHTKQMLGTATTSIDAYDADSIIRELKKGNTQLNKNYIPMNLLIDWAKQRMTISYEDILLYIKKNYPAPKAWLSEALLHKFLFSRHTKWYNALARFGMSCSVLYGGIKAITYL